MARFWHGPAPRPCSASPGIAWWCARAPHACERGPGAGPLRWHAIGLAAVGCGHRAIPSSRPRALEPPIGPAAPAGSGPERRPMKGRHAAPLAAPCSPGSSLPGRRRRHHERADRPDRRHGGHPPPARHVADSRASPSADRRVSGVTLNSLRRAQPDVERRRPREVLQRRRQRHAQGAGRRLASSRSRPGC